MGQVYRLQVHQELFPEIIWMKDQVQDFHLWWRNTKNLNQMIERCIRVYHNAQTGIRKKTSTNKSLKYWNQCCLNPLWEEQRQWWEKKRNLTSVWFRIIAMVFVLKRCWLTRFHASCLLIRLSSLSFSMKWMLGFSPRPYCSTWSTQLNKFLPRVRKLFSLLQDILQIIPMLQEFQATIRIWRRPLISLMLKGW